MYLTLASIKLIVLINNIKKYNIKLDITSVGPLGAAGGRGPLVAPAQGGAFRILRLCERLVFLDDSLDHRAAALLHPL